MYIDKVTTWTTDEYLDSVYENLRRKHFQNTSHRLYKNYNSSHVNELSAKSIYWGEDGEPKIICSILSRPCWPKNVFRILNRLWKSNMNSGNILSIDKGFSKLVVDQVKWCQSNNAQGVFMSRQTSGKWQRWAADIFNNETGLNFITPTEKFLTCENENDASCWQKIIFLGNDKLLYNWKQQQHEVKAINY